MKKITTLLIACGCMMSLHLSAQDTSAFSALGVGLSIGSTGLDLELVTPVHRTLMLRGGLSALPLRLTRSVDAYYEGEIVPGQIDLDAQLQMINGKLLLDFYPFRLPFFLSGGFYLGNQKVATFNGRSDRDLTWDGYVFPSERGRVEAYVRTNAFKPYLGVGFGRAIPVGRLGFRMEAGAMAHGTPDISNKYGVELNSTQLDSSGGLAHALRIWKVYPVLSFRLTGRIL